jgi:hypothetical protein
MNVNQRLRTDDLLTGGCTENVFRLRSAILANTGYSGEKGERAWMIEKR